MTAQKDKGRNPTWISLVISLCIHGMFLGAVALFYEETAAVSQMPPKVMRVKFQDEANFPSPAMRSKLEKEPTSRLDINSQVVDVLDTKTSDSPPPETRFLSDRNRRVEKETQARDTGPVASNSPPSQGQSNPGKTMPETAPGLFGKPVEPKLPLTENLFGLDGTGKGIASLPPSNYLPDIEFGDETLLNTREYAYATFFIRMKRQMEAVWDPRSILRSREQRRDQYVTKVAIILDGKGWLKESRVVESSGVQALDQVAVEAVRKASPYLNPPSGIIGEDGLVRIPNWHFIVTLRPIL